MSQELTVLKEILQIDMEQSEFIRKGHEEFIDSVSEILTDEWKDKTRTFIQQTQRKDLLDILNKSQVGGKRRMSRKLKGGWTQTMTINETSTTNKNNVLTLQLKRSSNSTTSKLIQDIQEMERMQDKINNNWAVIQALRCYILYLFTLAFEDIKFDTINRTANYNTSQNGGGRNRSKITMQIIRDYHTLPIEQQMDLTKVIITKSFDYLRIAFAGDLAYFEDKGSEKVTLSSYLQKTFLMKLTQYVQDIQTQIQQTFENDTVISKIPKLLTIISTTVKAFDKSLDFLFEFIKFVFGVLEVANKAGVIDTTLKNPSIKEISELRRIIKITRTAIEFGNQNDLIENDLKKLLKGQNVLEVSGGMSNNVKQMEMVYREFKTKLGVHGQGNVLVLNLLYTICILQKSTDIVQSNSSKIVSTLERFDIRTLANLNSIVKQYEHKSAELRRTFDSMKSSLRYVTKVWGSKQIGNTVDKTKATFNEVYEQVSNNEWFYHLAPLFSIVKSTCKFAKKASEATSTIFLKYIAGSSALIVAHIVIFASSYAAFGIDHLLRERRIPISKMQDILKSINTVNIQNAMNNLAEKIEVGEQLTKGLESANFACSFVLTAKNELKNEVESTKQRLSNLFYSAKDYIIDRINDIADIAHTTNKTLTNTIIKELENIREKDGDNNRLINDAIQDVENFRNEITNTINAKTTSITKEIEMKGEDVLIEIAKDLVIGKIDNDFKIAQLWESFNRYFITQKNTLLNLLLDKLKGISYNSTKTAIDNITHAMNANEKLFNYTPASELFNQQKSLSTPISIMCDSAIDAINNLKEAITIASQKHLIDKQKEVFATQINNTFDKVLANIEQTKNSALENVQNLTTTDLLRTFQQYILNDPNQPPSIIANTKKVIISSKEVISKDIKLIIVSLKNTGMDANMLAGFEEDVKVALWKYVDTFARFAGNKAVKSIQQLLKISRNSYTRTVAEIGKVTKVLGKKINEIPDEYTRLKELLKSPTTNNDVINNFIVSSTEEYLRTIKNMDNAKLGNLEDTLISFEVRVKAFASEQLRHLKDVLQVQKSLNNANRKVSISSISIDVQDTAGMKKSRFFNILRKKTPSATSIVSLIERLDMLISQLEPFVQNNNDKNAISNSITMKTLPQINSTSDIKKATLVTKDQAEEVVTSTLCSFADMLNIDDEEEETVVQAFGTGVDIESILLQGLNTEGVSEMTSYVERYNSLFNSNNVSNTAKDTEAINDAIDRQLDVHLEGYNTRKNPVFTDGNDETDEEIEEDIDGLFDDRYSISNSNRYSISNSTSLNQSWGSDNSSRSEMWATPRQRPRPTSSAELNGMMMKIEDVSGGRFTSRNIKQLTPSSRTKKDVQRAFLNKYSRNELMMYSMLKKYKISVNASKKDMIDSIIKKNKSNKQKTHVM